MTPKSIPKLLPSKTSLLRAGFRVIILSLGLGFAATLNAEPGSYSKNVILSGELKLWHKITLDFRGPESSETGSPNPFFDYRLDVKFTHVESTKTYTIPGYFAADGNAANSGATEGSVWRVHFAPDMVGEWTYTVRFLKGSGIASAEDVSAGESFAFDGTQGQFSVGPSDKIGRDNRAKGRLQYVGEHYLKFAGNGEYFLKQGADAPENFLSYQGFDGDFKTDGYRDELVKDWAPHIRDWREGDPTWGDGEQGKGIIGAINYLASEGLNSVSFLTFNVEGDDKNVYPYLNYEERYRMDCSKLDQWAIVFEHANSEGMYLHFKTQETENEMLMDNGNVGPVRTLYYRELIARFGHNLALNWNLGEENGKWGKSNKKPVYQSTEQRRAMAQWFYKNDPYSHHLVIHNGQNGNDLIGDKSKLTGFSLQTNRPNFENVPTRVSSYVRNSAKAGRPWVVACDEPGDAKKAIRPDDDPGESHEDGRRNALWGCIMNQGAGSEYYFGYQAAHSDLTCNDYRSRDRWWDYCRFALEFFDTYDVKFWRLVHDHSLVNSKSAWCMATPGVDYLIYQKDSSEPVKLDLRGVEGKFTIRWYNPRTGGALLAGSLESVTAGDQVSLGTPPDGHSTDDWVVLVTQSDV